MQSKWVRISICISTVLLATAGAQGRGKPSASTPERSIPLAVASTSISVFFKGVDRNGYAILTYGGVSLKAQLDGIKLRTDAPGIIKIFLPTGVQLRAEVVKKGTIPVIILWKGKMNMNQRLMFHGAATEIRK